MELDEYRKFEEEDEFSNDSAITHSPSSANGFVYKATSIHFAEEAKSLINFRANNTGGESFLSFQQQKEYCLWENHDDNNNNNGLHHQWDQNSDDPTLIQDFNCIQTATSGYGSKEKKLQHHQGESSYGWLYSGPNDPSDNNNSLQNSSSPRAIKEASSFNKRLSTGESMQASKKQCTAAAAAASKSAAKPTKSSNPSSKDPQSIAAKNRRERISERLKILQELVPNGSKVDLVTMLEKAISYVKFLQLQVKVLATDEFWPVQGGKAPDISQVKEAIDAILSSQRERNSSTPKQQK